MHRQTFLHLMMRSDGALPLCTIITLSMTIVSGSFLQLSNNGILKSWLWMTKTAHWLTSASVGPGWPIIMASAHFDWFPHTENLSYVGCSTSQCFFMDFITTERKIKQGLWYCGKSHEDRGRASVSSTGLEPGEPSAVYSLGWWDFSLYSFLPAHNTLPMTWSWLLSSSSANFLYALPTGNDSTLNTCHTVTVW